MRDGDYKLIWGQSDLLKKNFGRRRTKTELYNIATDPYEEHKLPLKNYKHIITDMKKTIKASYPLARFPQRHTNVEAAFPGNNNGSFVTGWC